jgi:SAM-dependent methyltransferase
MTDKSRTSSAATELYGALVAPISCAKLKLIATGLEDSSSGKIFRFVEGNTKVVDFVEPFANDDYDRANLEMYNSVHSTEIYRNFLTWLFSTFDLAEQPFRQELLAHLDLKKGMKALITGCGLGDDIEIVGSFVGPTGEIHAQDISKAMVLEAATKNVHPNTLFTISNATILPYASRYFDAVFHFGGINLFGDTKKAIAELERVCKIGGKVVFGDEGIATHLRNTEYAKIAITNNQLWSTEPPLDRLPTNAVDIQLNYILGNCFYVISFTPNDGFPHMNLDVPHKGLRGGTARTRYYGQLEGVTPETRKKIYAKAKELNVSVHSLLETIVNSCL